MTKVEYPEAMARFRCNEQGCCCQRWIVTMQPPDLRRLLTHFSDAEMKEILRGAEFHNDREGRLSTFSLRQEGPMRACQFLADDKRCGMQVSHGTEVLPMICRAYPAGALYVGDTRQLVWDASCPEVLEQLDEDDAPLTIVTRDVEEGDHLEVRSRFRFALPPMKMSERELEWDDDEIIRRRLIEAFNARKAPPLRLLAAANWALWRVAGGDAVDSFELRDDDPMAPFEDYFETCYRAHDASLLANQMEDYRRFVYALELGDDWAGLEWLLRPRRGWRAVVDPEDARLAPLLYRYLVHRAYAPFGLSFVSSQIDTVFGAITHHLATAFRMAVALVQWLELTDVRTAVKVALGASEFAYRSFKRAPVAAMPWFDPSPAADD